MIKSLRLENFKSFKSLELPDVATITLIGGQNNVGKTSLLEGIFLFYDLGNPGQFLRHLRWRGVGVLSSDADSIIAPAFRDFDLQNQMKITVYDGIYHAVMEMTFNSDSAQESVDIDLVESGDAFPQMKTNFTAQMSYTIDINYKIESRDKQDKLNEQNIHLVVTPGPTNMNTQFDTSQMKTHLDKIRHRILYLGLRMKGDPDDALRFSRLDIEKRSQQVLDFLQVLEPNLRELSSVSLPQQRPMMYADIGLTRKIPVAFLGEGMSRLLSIILAIATAKNGIVLIDEIDAGIHHSRMAKVWEGISKAAHAFNCQIFATTHSYECLQAAHAGIEQADMARDFRYIRLDKHGEDVVAKTYTHEVLGAALARGWEVR